MAFRAGTVLRHLVKLTPRHGARIAISNISRGNFVASFTNSLSCSPSRITIPALSVHSVRTFSDHHDDEQSLEEKTMDVLRLFDKVEVSKVYSIYIDCFRPPPA